MSSNTVSGRGYQGIYLPTGTVPVSGTWTKPGDDFPYLPSGDVTVAQGATLRLDPGVVFGATGSGFYVNGTLLAVGTAAQPILFTSDYATPSPGNWKGIYLGPQAGASVLSFCNVLYAGGGNLGYFNSAYRSTALYLDQCSPTLADLQVSRSASLGMQLYGSSGLIQSCLINSNNADGIQLSGGSPQVINNTIVANSGSGVHSAGGAPSLANNILALNGQNGARLDTGAMILGHNDLFQNGAGAYSGIAAGPGDLAVDPQFVNPALVNYRLLATSPLLRVGDATVVDPAWLDLDGNFRVQAGQVDLGAYELGATAPQRLVDGLIRNLGETNYTGGGLFDLPDQTKTQAVGAGVPAVYQLQAVYSGNVPGSVLLFGTAGGNGWTVRFFDAATGGQDITPQVTSVTGYVWSAAPPSASKQFRLEVTPDATVSSNTAKQVLVEFVSAEQPTQRDELAAVTTYGAASSAPKLGARFLAGSQIEISWEPGAANPTLESTESLTAPVQWTPVPGVTNHSIVISVDPTVPHRFYRLRQ